MKWTRVSTIVAVCSLVGLLWRAEGLMRRSFWLDEVLTFWRARLPSIHSLLDDLESAPFPPLYYLLLWVWAQFWGISELAVRALPMAFGVATLPLTYLVWSGLIGRRNALWAVALLSTNAYHVFYSQDAKMYAAVWLLATLSGGAFLHALEGGPRQRAWLVLYGVSNAASLLTSYVGVVPLAIQSLYGLLALRRLRPVAGKVAFAAILSCLPCLVWLPTTLRTVSHRTGISWIPPASGRHMLSELSQAFGFYVLGYRAVPNPPNDWYGLFFSRIYGPAVCLVGGVVLVYLIRLARSRRDVRSREAPARGDSGLVLYLVLWAFLPALACFLLSMTTYPLWGPPRYLMASGPAIIVLLAVALGSMERRALACVIGASLISANAAMILFEKTHVTTDPYRQMVGTCAAFARQSPGFQGDPTHAGGPFSVIHLGNGSLSDWNAVCVKYEIDEINTAIREDILRLDKLEKAVGRGLPFFMIELEPAELSSAGARERLEGRIASLQADHGRGSGRYEIRPIFSAEVRADGPLPNPTMRHTAQLWACLPAATRSPVMDPARGSSRPFPPGANRAGRAGLGPTREATRDHRRTVTKISPPVLGALRICL
jgi:hypothetical protein